MLHLCQAIIDAKTFHVMISYRSASEKYTAHRLHHHLSALKTEVGKTHRAVQPRAPADLLVAAVLAWLLCTAIVPAVLLLTLCPI